MQDPDHQRRTEGLRRLGPVLAGLAVVAALAGGVPRGLLGDHRALVEGGIRVAIGLCAVVVMRAAWAGRRRR